MAQPRDRIDDLQASRATDSQQVNREAAIRHALGQLDPHNDDGQCGYVELLRRLQGAIDVALSKWTSAPTQPPGPSGETAVAEPQKAE